MARRRPRLAASAVDRVVLGPGVKLATVASTRRAVSSTLFMACTVTPASRKAGAIPCFLVLFKA